MGYAAFLRELLRPLGVYDLKERSFSGAELEALGREMDHLLAKAEEVHTESLPVTAKAAGLDMVQALFPLPVPTEELTQRRNALAGFLSVSGDSFTLQQLQRGLSACGTACTLRETGAPFTVEVRFPDCAGLPQNLEEKKRIIESLLPCHLQVEYIFSWRTWQELSPMTWEEVQGMTFLELATPEQ